MKEEEVDEEPYGDRARDGEDDEDDEGQDEYEKDGFIVDDVEEEEGEEEENRTDSDVERQKKKKKKKRDSERNHVPDEDDYELLQESNISVSHQKLLEGLEQMKPLKLRHSCSDTVWVCQTWVPEMFTHRNFIYHL